MIKRSDTSNSIESTKNESFHTHTHKIEKNNYRSQAVLNGLQWGTFFKKCHQKWVAVIPSACWMLSNILKKNVSSAKDPQVFHTSQTWGALDLYRQTWGSSLSPVGQVGRDTVWCFRNPMTPTNPPEMDGWEWNPVNNMVDFNYQLPSLNW